MAHALPPVVARLKRNLLTSEDLRRGIPGLRIVHYNELREGSTVDNVVGMYRPVVLLYPGASERDGHWTLVWQAYEKRGLVCNFFCPYGIRIDGMIYDGKAGLAEFPYLSRLMLSARGLVAYSEHPLQIFHPDVNTCGRWCILRWRFRHMDEDEFYRYFGPGGALASENGATPDDLAVLHTLNIAGVSP